MPRGSIKRGSTIKKCCEKLVLHIFMQAVEDLCSFPIIQENTAKDLFTKETFWSSYLFANTETFYKYAKEMRKEIDKKRLKRWQELHD